MALGGMIKKALGNLASKKMKEKAGQAMKMVLKTAKRVMLKVLFAHMLLPVLIIVLILVILSSIVKPTVLIEASESSGLLPLDDNYIVKTDEEGAAPAVSKAQLDEGIKIWLKPHKQMQENALRVSSAVIQAQEKHKVNGVFLIAIGRAESGIGTNSKHGANWWSLGLQNGASYSTPEACVEAAADEIENGKYYFTRQLYTVDEIGHQYCPDYDNPGQEAKWKEEIKGYMTELYEAMGITPTASAGSQGDILTNAKEIIEYARKHNFTYGAPGRDIPDIRNGKLLDCSSYVSWVLYESGYKEFKGHQHTSRDFLKNDMKWETVKEKDLQPGDILAYSGHVEIYAGNGKIYNAGSTKAIRRSDQPYKKTRSFEKAVRPPNISTNNANSQSKKRRWLY